jgi:hypothetical protein
MFNRNPFHHRPGAFARLVAVCALSLIAASLMARNIRQATAATAFDSTAASIPEIAFNEKAQTTEVRVGSGVPAPGTVNVPIELVARGAENAIGFSLTFDQNILTNPQAALGADAAAAALNTNASQAAQGRLGILLALPAGQSFSAGTRQLLTVAFTLAPNTTAFSATIGFGDQPITREIADVNANIVTTTFTPATITIQGYEADVTPRPSGNNNGQVTVADWTQVGRFVAGLDAAALGSEYQRADCAPRSSLGDGRLTASDYTQAGRYAAGLDPAVPAGGPTGPPAVALAANFDAGWRPSPANDHGDEARWLRAIDEGWGSGTHFLPLAFDLEARGGENAISFSLSFDPRQWRFVSAAAGADAGEASIIINDDGAAAGRLGVVIALPAGQALMAGARRIAIINFDLLSDDRDNHHLRAGSIGFSDYPASREVADVEANPLPTIFAFDRQSLRGRRP